MLSTPASRARSIVSKLSALEHFYIHDVIAEQQQQSIQAMVGREATIIHTIQNLDQLDSLVASTDKLSHRVADRVATITSILASYDAAQDRAAFPIQAVNVAKKKTTVATPSTSSTSSSTSTSSTATTSSIHTSTSSSTSAADTTPTSTPVKRTSGGNTFRLVSVTAEDEEGS